VDLKRVGIESTGSCGARLLRYMQIVGVEVLKVTAPDRLNRRKRGKPMSLVASLEVIRIWKQSASLNATSHAQSSASSCLVRTTSSRHASLLDKQKGVQDSQFTSTDFIKVLAAREIKISMDGKGVWRDNVFVERLWHTPSISSRFAFGPMPASRRPAPVLVDMSAFTAADGHIHRLTGKPQIRSTCTCR